MLSFKGYFSSSTIGVKFLILAFLLLLSLLLLSVALIVEAFLMHIPLNEVSNVVAGNNPTGIGFLKVVQTTQHILVFLLPALITTYLVSDSVRRFLKLSFTRDAAIFGLVILIMLTVIPFVNYLTYLNMSFTFPNWLQGFEVWAKEKEDSANQLIQMFFTNKSIQSLIGNVLIMAVLPAIAEEFLFRGVIQQFITKITGNLHTAIFITALIFSAMHMQFMGFVPRLFLGMLLGYIFVWTGSIWPAVLAHFTNNFIGVLSLHYMDTDTTGGWEQIGTPDGVFFTIVPATMLCGVLLYILYKRDVQNGKPN